MNRDQIIKIAMVVCIVVLLCTVIITSTGFFGESGNNGYANADQYSPGDAVISEGIRNLDIHWAGGRVTVAYHAENTVTLQETAKRLLSDDEKMQWWADGETLRIRFMRPGVRLNMPEKELTVTLPEGIILQEAFFETTSGEIIIPEMVTDTLRAASTSGSIQAYAEAKKAEIASTSGNTLVRLYGKTEEVRINSTSGSITVETEHAGIIDAGSTSGSIRITAEEGENVKAGSTSGSIDTALKKTGVLSISTTSGSVTATLPEEPGFTADIQTTSGKVDYSVPLTRNGNAYVCGDGSAQISIGTTSGNVRLNAPEK